MTPEKLRRTLERIGITITRESNNNFSALCPYHAEKDPSFGISIDEPHPFGCFGCQQKGTLFKLLVDIGKYSIERARKLCAMNETLSELPVVSDEPEEKSGHLIDPSLLYPFTLSKKARRYLASRGIKRENMRRAHIVYDYSENRILFPWYLDRRLVAVTGRTLDPDNVFKTQPYWGTKKRKHIYCPNGQILGGRLALVEGEVDALKVFCVFPNVGALGHGILSRGQAKLIRRSLCDEVCAFFDDDEIGEKLYTQVLEMLGPYKYVSRVNYAPFRRKYEARGIDKLDPGALSLAHIDKALKQAKKYEDWPDL